MIQIRLWNDCYNNCAFCSLNGFKSVTPINSKKTRINQLLTISDNRIGLIGGEFFEGQLYGCEDEWLNMIKNIKCNELFITANLINQQYLLKETLEVRPDILICTSYDSTGRFKNNIQKDLWLERLNSLQKSFCTIIPTQDILEDDFINKIKCGINLCEPHLGIEWYNKVDKSNYHQILIQENKLFNLPKRKDFLKWIMKFPSIINISKNYKETHFNTILKFDSNNIIVPESNFRFNNPNFMAECGHPHFSKCYADSNNCMMCDLEEL